MKKHELTPTDRAERRITYTEAEQRKLIEKAIKMDTYICGADGKLCGLPREAPPFLCQTCKRNKHWIV